MLLGAKNFRFPCERGHKHAVFYEGWLPPKLSLGFSYAFLMFSLVFLMLRIVFYVFSIMLAKTSLLFFLTSNPILRCELCFLRQLFYKLIIHLKKLLSSDWQKRSAFLVNTVQKNETRVQIKTKISEVKTKTAGGQPMYFEDRRRACETFRRSYEAFRRLPKTTRNLPKITEDRPNISEDCPNTSEDLRQSPAISKDHRIFSKLFQVLEDRTQYLLCTSVVNVWSEALSCLFFQVYY